MSLPIFKATINNDDSDNLEVDYIALVDRPAIQKNFLAFNDKARYNFNEDQQIVSGPAMIPDQPIYRNTVEGEFYVYFDAATIADIAKRFFRKGYNSNLNLSHDPALQLKASYVFESWIVDRDKGKHPLSGFEDLPNGTWFLSAKIEDAGLWNDIKSGKFKGFSVEGMFQLSKLQDGKPEEKEQEYSAEFIEGLKKILQDFNP